MPGPEARLMREVIRELKKIPGIWGFKKHGGRWGRAGIPDLIGCYQGRFFALELKAPGAVATPLQLRELRLIADAGGIAAVVYTLAEVFAALGIDVPAKRTPRGA